MKFFLKLKHWQLFILLIGIPGVLYAALTMVLFSKLISLINHININPDPSEFLIIWAYMPGIILLATILFFCWFYTLGTNLHRRLPTDVKMNSLLFKIFLTIFAISTLLLCYFLYHFYSNIIPSAAQGHPPYISPLIILIIPLQFFSVFCIFYCMYFVAKSLKSIELQREAVFGEYIIEIILILFLIVGIWFLQPKINNLFAEETEQ